MSRLPSYHERLDALTEQLTACGSLGLVTFDAGALGQVEGEYGVEASREVRQRLLDVLEEQRGKDYRSGDLMVLDQPHGLVFTLFLGHKRRRNVPFTPLDLRAARSRLALALSPALARTAFPYRKTPPRIATGSALALHNPLRHPAGVIERALREALAAADHFRRVEHMAQRERLLDVLLRERVATAYQPIQLLSDRSLLGFEALSRGARGSGLESAEVLFQAADEHDYLLELDRLCRTKALLNSSRIPSTARLFVNALPATIRDPTFRGRPLIDFLDRVRLSPERLVIEITERLVIDNYSLFREALAYYTDLGMSFAVDDVGSGYSGLESIAKLKPHFLKIDMSLVRDVHVSVVNREMVKAMVSLGQGIGATVIAEGIQSQEEAHALQAMGVNYGQGYYLARPEMGPE